MIKKTYKELSKLDMVVVQMYIKSPELKDTKFGYGYKRFYEKNLKSVFHEYFVHLSDVRIDNALIDERTKAIITTEGGRGFEYSREGLKAVIRAEKTLEEEWGLKEFEVEPYIIKSEDMPKLTDEQSELMKGILIE